MLEQRMRKNRIGLEVWMPELLPEDQYIGRVIYETPKSVTVEGKYSNYKFNEKNKVWKFQSGIPTTLEFREAAE